MDCAPLECRYFLWSIGRSLAWPDVFLAFLQFWAFSKQRIQAHPQLAKKGWTAQQIDDLQFVASLVPLVLAHLGYFSTHPFAILNDPKHQ
jgi:prolipoprotein diacylglyceryltransferase